MWWPVVACGGDNCCGEEKKMEEEEEKAGILECGCKGMCRWIRARIHRRGSEWDLITLKLDPRPIGGIHAVRITAQVGSDNDNQDNLCQSMIIRKRLGVWITRILLFIFLIFSRAINRRLLFK